MNKGTFLHQLRIRLSQLPEKEIEERLNYYNEMIDDMAEDGMSEEDAVNSFGDINLLAQQIMQDAPLSTLVKTKMKPKNGWSMAAIVVAVIGSPIWVPLLLVFITIIASVYLVICVCLISLFVVVAAIGISGIYLMIKGFLILSTGFPITIFTVGCGLFLAGACLFAFLGARIAAIGLIDLTKWIFIQINRSFRHWLCCGCGFLVHHPSRPLEYRVQLWS